MKHQNYIFVYSNELTIYGFSSYFKVLYFDFYLLMPFSMLHLTVVQPLSLCLIYFSASNIACNGVIHLVASWFGLML